ncbi:MAG: InlB B-repeat-containing protein [Bacteroidetes bacterium]|nr:InlB B-repeat-containing protein [Bacteroidota bacterium]
MKPKKLLTIALFALLAATQAWAQPIWNGTTATNWTGSGNSEADPYLITTAEQLAGLAAQTKAGNTFKGKFIKLANDIWLNAPNTPRDDRNEWQPIGDFEYVDAGVKNEKGELEYVVGTMFSGTFDGGGHTIYGVSNNDSIPDNSDWYDWGNWYFGATLNFEGFCSGFFGRINSDATIQNLNLKDVNITGCYDVAGLVATNNGTIRNCSVVGGVVTTSTDGSAGDGIAGINNGTIDNCFADVETIGWRVSGFVGNNEENGTITNSSAAGNAFNWSEKSNIISGFVCVNAGFINNCYSTGNVTNNAGNTNAVGAGFVGVNQETAIITNSYSTGNVSGAMDGVYSFGGGFVAENRGYIANCYALGDVSANCRGFAWTNSHYTTDWSLTGNTNATIINCFYAGNSLTMNGFTNRSGILINNYFDVKKSGFDVEDGGEPRTTEYMQSQAFVDTLNMFSALFGLNTWVHTPGEYPKPSGTVATNLSDYLKGGAGTESNPYLIETKEQLSNFATYVNKGHWFNDEYIQMTADIAWSNTPREEWGANPPPSFKPIGHRFTKAYTGTSSISVVSKPFCGTFNGSGHTISNLRINSNTDNQGLFGYVHYGVIKNLNIEGAYVRGNLNVGILAGMVDQGTIDNCHSTGEVLGAVLPSSTPIGGLVGAFDVSQLRLFAPKENFQHTIKNCYSTAEVKNVTSGAIAGGGLLGGASATASIENCYAMGGLHLIGISQAYQKNTYTTTTTKPTNFYSDRFSNVFYQSNDAPIDKEERKPRTKEYMQSKSFVNELNYPAAVNNATEEWKYLYWQYNENDYPTFTAILPPTVTVTFVSNGGSEVVAQPVLAGSHPIAPPAPTLNGFTLAGWYTDEALENLFTFGTDVIDNNITLYAKWAPNFAPDITWYTENTHLNEFTIYTVEQLAGLAALVNGTTSWGVFDFKGKTVNLGNDIAINDTTNWQQWGINLTAQSWTPIGVNYMQGFEGTFNGKGYTVSGVYINSYNGTNLGLFGSIGVNGVIKNLGVVASYVRGSTELGILAGRIDGGTITNCYAVGNVVSTKLVSSYMSDSNAGVLVGTAFNAKIDNCYAMGRVEGGRYIGGLVGNTPTTGVTTITNCYAVVAVTGKSDVGGLKGYPNATTAIPNSYYDSQISTLTTTNASAKATLSMKQIATFAGWDFNTIWGRNDNINGGYPYLRMGKTEPNDADKTVTITFNSNGGSAVSPASTVVTIGQKLSKPANPTRAGLEFAGWFSNKELTQAVDFSADITYEKDTTLYAGWLITLINTTFATEESVSNWGLKGVTWNSSTKLSFIISGATAQVMPLLPQNKTNLSVELTTVNGAYLTMQTSPDNVDYADYGKVTANNATSTATIALPDSTRYIAFTSTGTNTPRLTALKVKWILGSEDPFTTVTFDGNGGLNKSDGTPYAQQVTVVTGMPVQLPAVLPVKPGEIIEGWYFDTELTKPYSSKTEILGATTIYAKWKSGYMDVTFESNGGSAVAPKSVFMGEKVTAPANPTRAGYVFVRWCTDEGLTTAFNFTATVITEPVTLYAAWNVSYYVSINSQAEVSNWTLGDGVTYSNGQLNFTKSGAYIDLPVLPALRKGITITITGTSYNYLSVETSAIGGVGMYTNQGAFTTATKNLPDNTRYIRITATSAISIALTSIRISWLNDSENPVATVTFETNGGNAIAQRGAIKGMTYAPPAPTKTGHTFNGWYLDEALETGFSNTVIIQDDAFTLYAKWTPELRKVTFNANSGTAVAPIDTDYGTPITEPEEPTRANYIFRGWYTDNTTFLKPFDFATPITANITLYAKWEALLSVVFNTGTGGTVIPTQWVETGATVPQPEDPERAGYLFKGWVTTSGGSVEFDFANPITVSRTIYASWAILRTVTFNTGTGGSEIPTQYVENGTPAQRPEEDPTRANFVFKGWVTTSGGTTAFNFANPITANTTVYARWAAAYAISWSVNDEIVQSEFVEQGVIPTFNGETPEKEATAQYSYTFTGWSPAITAATAARTYTAQFSQTLRSYDVIFNSNGGSNVAKQTVTYGNKATTPTAPTKADSTFVAWYSNKELTTAFNFTTTITGEITLYAKWECAHDFSVPNMTLAATCTLKGAGYYTCSFCGATGSNYEIPATGHSFGAWAITTATTCQAKGTETRTCSTCGATETRDIPQLAHTFGNWAVTTAATCSAAGEETRTCSICSKVETRPIAQLPHTFGNWTVTTAATCEAKGTETRTCSQCSATETQDIPQLTEGCCVGIDEISANEIIVYPNPTKGQLTISGVETQCIASLPQTVEIYDNTGRLVETLQETRHATSLHGNGLTIDISHLPTGIYFIQINGKRVKVVKK